MMPLLEEYREFFDFSPDWPGEKFGDLRERNGGKYRNITNISQNITNSLAVNSVNSVRS